VVDCRVMRAHFRITLLLISGAALMAQAPSPPPVAAHSYKSDLGFSYDLPSDWEVVDTQANLAQVKQQAAQNATSEDEKKGLDCVQLGLTARHGTSVIVDVALPFDCFGKQVTDKDLPGFGEGASQGVKQGFDIGDPTYGWYALGSHNLWIERVIGTPKGQAGASYTVEIACAVLKKAAVCWMAMASDDATLKTFEHGMVSLDGEAPVALVPATAFDKKPS
jgi:hypothetical protein